MTARGKMHGHDIQWDEGREEWLFTDTGEPTVETWRDRPCGHCGMHATPEGHDGCLGTLPEHIVRNACCGHGNDDEAYVQFWDGACVRGAEALEEIEKLRKEAIQ